MNEDLRDYARLGLVHHLLYGDTHPPIGFPGGEVGAPEITDILRCLLDVGYLNTSDRGDLLLEMTVWPGRTVEQTVDDAFELLTQAWQRV